MATGNAKRFIELGMAPPLATELAAQITASAGNVRRLREVGIASGKAASIMAASVVSHTVNLNALTQTGIIPAVAKEFATQIAS